MKNILPDGPKPKGDAPFVDANGKPLEGYAVAAEMLRRMEPKKACPTCSRPDWQIPCPDCGKES